MGEAMRQMISAIWSIILGGLAAFLKSDEHRYCCDTGLGRKDTGCLQVIESAAEFLKVGEWALFWGGTGIGKRELRRSVSTLPAQTPTVPAGARSFPAQTPTLPAQACSVPAGTPTVPPWFL